MIYDKICLIRIFERFVDKFVKTYQLKAKYDLTGKDLKTFINDTLIDELDSLFAVTTKGCLLSNTTNQAITTATGTNLSFDTEVYDTDGFHSPSVNPSRITIPAGVSKIKLHFNCQFENNATGIRYILMHKNGSGFAGTGSLVTTASNVASIGNHCNISSAPITVSENDYFEARVYQNSGGSLNVLLGDYTTFAIEVLD